MLRPRCGKDIDALRNNIPNSLVTGLYFFHRLKGAGWLHPLREIGAFREIPPMVRIEEGISCPPWPAADFLKRCVTTDPEEVAQVLREAPETDNWRAVADLADLASAVAVDAAAQWSERVAGWIRSQESLSFGVARQLGSLAANLAGRGKASAGLQLAAALLEVRPGRSEEGPEESPFKNLREPSARFDLWEYEEILKQDIPSLVDAAGAQTLALLMQVLDDAILLSDRRGEERRPEDLSYIWLPAIEEHSQNLRAARPKSLLVAAVRDAAERIVENSPISLKSVIAALESKGSSWKIFNRLALHLVHIFGDGDRGLVKEGLLNHGYFDSADMKHEYALLAKKYFALLDVKDQELIFDWVDQGPPNLDNRLAAWAEYRGRAVTEEDRRILVRQWKRNQLALFRDHLDTSKAEDYKALVQELGDPRHPEFSSYSEGGAFGPGSPKSSEEIERLTVKDLVRYLLEWRPASESIHGPSREGLGRDVKASVAKIPERYAADIVEFKRLVEPTYIRGVIEGFHAALKEKRKFDWHSVLTLCQWAASQTREVPGRSDEDDFRNEDPHWGWARASIVRLLKDGFVCDENPLPISLRAEVWGIIEPITADPDPMPERARSREAANQSWQELGIKIRRPDLMTTAINSVRGEAIECVLQYALWVEAAALHQEDSVNGFADMPEVRMMLERHLDPAVDSSAAIRAIYGERFAQLYRLDRKWLAANITKIFDRHDLNFWHAAWDTYIYGWTPPDGIFDLLKNEYAFAVEHIDTTVDETGLPSPDHALGRHLVMFYTRAILELKAPILRDFFGRADVRVRASALNALGVGLHEMKEALTPDAAARLKLLLEERLSLAEKGAAGDIPKEMKEYGWWFASGKFDDEWSLSTLIRVLRVGAQPEPSHLVVQRLAELCGSNPFPCVQALGLMIAADTKGWGILGWSEDAKEIVRTARKSQDDAARKEAEGLANSLGSRGHFDFLALLTEPEA
jgi:hypothetical protein